MATFEAPPTNGRAWLKTEVERDRLVVSVGGQWNLSGAERMEKEMRRLVSEAGQAVRIDMRGVDRLDTAGAWLLYRTAKRLRYEGARVEFFSARPEQAALLEQMQRHDQPVQVEPEPVNPVVAFIAQCGKAGIDLAVEAREMVAFLGLVVLAVVHTLVQPHRLRFTPTVRHVERAGLNALPVVGAVSFLIGGTLAFQGAFQLRNFGAEIFIVNLVALSVLREIGMMLTAILVAARSGSAFSSEIGTMKINEEVDAMRTIGIDPIEVLVVPRILALMVVLPLLGFFADIMGLLGGGVVSAVELGISPAEYIAQLEKAVSPWAFGVGLIKAPVFAFIIAFTGCYMGFRVVGSAESVGRMTTLAVVHSIFLLILADALFSVFFSFIGI